MNNDTIWLIIWAAVILGVFAWVWRAGHLARFANYVLLTREELRKCTWPTLDELKGSTVVVTVAIVILGTFTIIIDWIFLQFLGRIT
jgi:preprotein translocase subunit SecE